MAPNPIAKRATQTKSVKKRNPTATRFEIRRSKLYQKKGKPAPPMRDVIGNKLTNITSKVAGERRTHSSVRRSNGNPDDTVASISFEEIAARSQAAADFLIQLRNEHARMSLVTRIRERQLAVLRREAPEPTWFGIGSRTPQELELIRKREVQSIFVDGEYAIQLGKEYAGASANIVNIAATFNLGISNIDTRGILLFENGIDGYYGTRRFPACNVYLALELYGKVLSVRMFQSGKVSITGAKSRHEALHGAHLFVYYLRRHQIHCHVIDFQIRNVVLVFNVGHRIDIDEMSATFPKLMPSGNSSTMLDTSVAYDTSTSSSTDDPRAMVYPTNDRPIRQSAAAPIPYLLTGPPSSSALLSFDDFLSVPTYVHWSDDPRDEGLPRPTIVRNDTFMALILRINPNKPPAVLVNPSGIGVLCGAPSIEEATESMRRAVRIMNKFKASAKAEQHTSFEVEPQSGDTLNSYGVSSIVAQIAALGAPRSTSDDPRTRKFGRYGLDQDENDDEEEDEIAEAARIRKEAELIADIFGDKGESLLGTCLDEIVHHEVVNQGYSGLILMDENDTHDDRTIVHNE